MIHPLLRLLVKQPRLLTEHVEAYAHLVGDEVSKVSTMWIMRIVLYVAGGVLALLGLIFVGVALMLFGAVPSVRHRARLAADRGAAGAAARRGRLHLARACAVEPRRGGHGQGAAERRHGDAARGGFGMSTTTYSPGTTPLGTAPGSTSAGSTHVRREQPADPWTAAALQRIDAAAAPSTAPSVASGREPIDDESSLSAAERMEASRQRLRQRDAANRTPGAAVDTDRNLRQGASRGAERRSTRVQAIPGASLLAATLERWWARHPLARRDGHGAASRRVVSLRAAQPGAAGARRRSRWALHWSFCGRGVCCCGAAC